MSSKRYYIVKGLLEPIHLNENERELLVEGMHDSVVKIVQEVYKSTEIFRETVGSLSEEMQQKVTET